jgi:hypothetical protein
MSGNGTSTFPSFTSVQTPPDLEAGGQASADTYTAVASNGLETPIRPYSDVPTTSTAEPITSIGSSSTPTSANLDDLNENGGSDHMAGAIAGSFLGGAVAALAMVFAFLAWRKKSQRRQRRDQHIQDSFTALTTHPFEDEKPPRERPTEKPLPQIVANDQSRKRARSGESNTIAGASHIASQLAKRPISDPISLEDINGEAPLTAAASKRLSFPAALQPGQPRRTISISASGLIAPVAASEVAHEAHICDQVVKQLRLQLSTMFEQIGLHVDNFYQSSSPTNRVTQLTLEEQQRLHAVDSRHLHDSIAGIWPFAEDVRPLIKHTISDSIVARLEYRGRIEVRHALLPSGLLETYRMMAASNENDSAAALSQWRTQTLSMLGIKNVEASMNSQVKTLATNLTRAFEPWALPRYRAEARTSHLRRVLMEAVELGLEIFSLRQEVEWVWKAPDGSSHESIAVFPGLVVRICSETLSRDNPVSRSSGDCGISVVDPVLLDTRYIHLEKAKG